MLKTAANATKTWVATVNAARNLATKVPSDKTETPANDKTSDDETQKKPFIMRLGRTSNTGWGRGKGGDDSHSKPSNPPYDYHVDGMD